MFDAAPTLSVCIPTYRGAAHLRAAIDSVLAQDFRDFELVIVDDNSPDDTTTAIVNAYRDSRILYMRNATNLGPQGNWNHCLEVARGKYFKLLPQDDELMPGCLRQQVEVLERDVEKAIALTFCARVIIGPDGKLLMHRGYPAHSGRIAGHGVIRRCVRRGTNLIGEPGAVMFRRELAQRIGPFSAENPYVIDLDYWFRLLATGDAYHERQPLASFRISSGSWSVAIGTRQTRDFREFIARYAAKPDYGIGKADALAGYCMAGINTRLRTLFYRCLLRQVA